ncbi:MAG: hypothetical protein JSW08_01680 [archaeon]|nr:MAG: hypothetical protein JSW08_01680 [archaeon]
MFKEKTGIKLYGCADPQEIAEHLRGNHGWEYDSATRLFHRGFGDGASIIADLTPADFYRLNPRQRVLTGTLLSLHNHSSPVHRQYEYDLTQFMLGCPEILRATQVEDPSEN